MENEEIKNEVEETTEEVQEENNVEETTEKVEEEKKVEEIIEEKAESNNKSSKGSNGKTFAILGVVVLALAALLYFGYTKLFNPKQLFVNAINNNYKQLENLFDDTKNTTKLSDTKPAIVEEDLSLNLEVDDSLLDSDTKAIIDEINKLKINAKVGIDSKEKEGLVNLNALYDKSSLIDLGAYLKDNKIYFDLKDLYSKLIEVPLDEMDIELDQAKMNYDTEDLKYIVKTTKDAYLNNLDNKDFKKSTSTLKIDGKEVKTTRISYSLNEKEATELTKKAFKELIKDSKYINTLSKVSGADKKEIKDSIQEMLDELSDNKDFDEDTTITFNTYVKGFKHDNVGFDFVIEGKDTNTKLAYYKNADVKEISITSDDEFTLKAKITDKKIKINASADEQEVTINIDKKEEKNKKTYDYTISSQGVSLKGSVIVDVKEDSEDKYEAKITSSASMMGMAKATITVNVKAETVKSLDLPSLKDSISYDKLTEEDTNNIMNKLMQNEALQKLISNFSGNMNEALY